jgi:hypothetical protein
MIPREVALNDLEVLDQAMTRTGNEGCSVRLCTFNFGDIVAVIAPLNTDVRHR